MVYLSMTLQRSSGFLIDVDDNTIWVTRKIDPDVNLDLGHLLVNLRLQGNELAFYSLIVHRTFFSGFVFLMNGLRDPEIDVTLSKNVNSRS